MHLLTSRLDVANSIWLISITMQAKRIKVLQSGTDAKGMVVYWMSRDMRVGDNWALFYAQQEAQKRNSKFSVSTLGHIQQQMLNF